MCPRVGRAQEASDVVDAARVVASRLALGQVQGGPFEGSWSDEEAYTGTIVAGLVRAYEVTCDEETKVAAVAGGNFILRAAAGNYYGDEAYALMCLSAISEDESLDVWRLALNDFYGSVSRRAEGGTEEYVAQFGEADPSVAVFYLAHHTVAAFYVDAEDKSIWRDALVSQLIQVDDTAESPVMALGMATWALALTGPLDDSPVDPNGRGAPYWSGVTLEGLPELLLTQQVPDGEHAGSFYWRLDHTNGGFGGPPEGYTEELAAGALGLSAADEAIPDLEIEAAIELTRDCLVSSINEDGGVRQHLTLGGEAYFYEAAGVLRALECLDHDGLDPDCQRENLSGAAGRL